MKTLLVKTRMIELDHFLALSIVGNLDLLAHNRKQMTRQRLCTLFKLFQVVVMIRESEEMIHFGFLAEFSDSPSESIVFDDEHCDSNTLNLLAVDGRSTAS